MSRPPLRGFNHNIGYRKRSYHVQTEDSGIENPHIFTHLYLGGMIIATAKTDYAGLVADPDHKPRVVKMMQEQHKTLMKRLRRGEFDDKIIAMLGSLEPEGEEVSLEGAVLGEPADAGVDADADTAAAAGAEEEAAAAAKAEAEAAARAKAEAEAAARAKAEAEAAARAKAEAEAAARAKAKAEAAARAQAEAEAAARAQAEAEAAARAQAEAAAPAAGFADLRADELGEASTVVDPRRYPEMAGAPQVSARDTTVQEATVKDYPPEMAEGAEDSGDLLPEVFDAAVRMEQRTTPRGSGARVAPPEDPLYDTAQLLRDAPPTERMEVPPQVRRRQSSPVRLTEPIPEPVSVHTPESVPMIPDDLPPRQPPRAPAQRPGSPRERHAPVFGSLLGDAEEPAVRGPAQRQAPPIRPVDTAKLESRASGSRVTGPASPRQPIPPPVEDDAVFVDRPPEDWGEAASSFSAEARDLPSARPSQGHPPASARPPMGARRARVASEVFDAPLPKDSRLRTPPEMSEAVPGRKRPAGVYPLPSQMPSRPPHPDPTLRQPPRQAPSSPQRYTAPSRARASSARPVHVTGSYRVPSGSFPITEVPAPPRVSGPTRGTKQPGPPPQQRGGAVVARPVVVIGGQPPADPGRTQPPQQTRHPRPPAEPPRRQPRPSAPPAAPAPPSARRAQPSTRGMPNLFGSDLISERSLDEVILGYLAEEDARGDSDD